MLALAATFAQTRIAVAPSPRCHGLSGTRRRLTAADVSGWSCSCRFRSDPRRADGAVPGTLALDMPAPDRSRRLHRRHVHVELASRVGASRLQIDSARSRGSADRTKCQASARRGPLYGCCFLGRAIWRQARRIRHLRCNSGSSSTWSTAGRRDDCLLAGVPRQRWQARGWTARSWLEADSVDQDQFRDRRRPSPATRILVEACRRTCSSGCNGSTGVLPGSFPGASRTRRTRSRTFSAVANAHPA